MPIEENPPELHKISGMDYYESGNYRDALNEFELYLDEFPKDEEILMVAAICCQKLNEYEKAIKYYELVTEINEDNYSALNSWGNVLIALYNERKESFLLDAAIQKYEKALKIAPQNAVINNNLCGTLLRIWKINGEDEILLKAKKWAEKAIELDFDNKGNYFNLACCDSLMENKSEMLKHLEIAINYKVNYKKIAREDDDFEKYRDDEDFIALTKE